MHYSVTHFTKFNLTSTSTHPKHTSKPLTDSLSPPKSRTPPTTPTPAKSPGKPR